MYSGGMEELLGCSAMTASVVEHVLVKSGEEELHVLCQWLRDWTRKAVEVEALERGSCSSRCLVFVV